MIATPSPLVVTREMPSAHATVGASATGGGGGGVGEVGVLLQPIPISSTAKLRTQTERAPTVFTKHIDMNQPFYRIRSGGVSRVQIRNTLA